MLVENLYKYLLITTTRRKCLTTQNIDDENKVVFFFVKNSLERISVVFPSIVACIENVDEFVDDVFSSKVL